MVDKLLNQNTILILLAVGTIIWVVRQVLPVKIEKSKAWKILLRVLPVALGVGVAMIPQLRPMDDLVSSAVVGGVAGSFSATTYGFIRELFGKRIKALLGSKASRVDSEE